MSNIWCHNYVEMKMLYFAEIQNVQILMRNDQIFDVIHERTKYSNMKTIQNISSIRCWLYIHLYSMLRCKPYKHLPICLP